MSSVGSKKRANLVVRYVPLELKSKEEITGIIGTVLPMAAMFLRNRIIAWGALLVAIQSYLNETEAQARESSQPAYLKVMMSFAGLLVCYLDLFFAGGGLGSLGGLGGTVASATTTRLTMAPRATSM
ncbi:hypothetical protein V1512DRAFT_256098 [Lipomyces arxii]|uniref:uncharacterized protein n=1 Tax=Lipomyces arxii TaxID=56418 RepID=UPI0034CF25C7